MILDRLPQARIQRQSIGWRTSWHATELHLAVIAASMLPMFFAAGNGESALALVVLGLVLSACAFAWVAYSTRVQPIRASWDDRRLTVVVSSTTTHTWPWRAIDSLGFDSNDIVLVAEGIEHRFRAPPAVADRDRLLQHWRAHLEERAPEPETQPPIWAAQPTGMTIQPRFEHAEVAQRSWHGRGTVVALALVLAVVSLTRLLGWGVEVGAEFDPAWQDLASTARFWSWGVGLLTAPFVVLGSLFGWWREQRAGTLTIDAHRLVLEPPKGASLSVLWEDIEDLRGDDDSLTVVTDGHAHRFDFSAERPAVVRGLVQELQQRWTKVLDASDDPEEAERRRQQLLGLVGQAR